MFIVAVEREKVGFIHLVSDSFFEAQKAFKTLDLDLFENTEIASDISYEVLSNILFPLNAILLNSNGIVTLSLSEIPKSSDAYKSFVNYRNNVRFNLSYEDFEMLEDNYEIYELCFSN